MAETKKSPNDIIKEAEIARQLNSLCDINPNIMNLASKDILHDVICDYFLNRDLSDSESDPETCESDESDESEHPILGLQLHDEHQCMQHDALQPEQEPDTQEEHEGLL